MATMTITKESIQNNVVVKANCMIEGHIDLDLLHGKIVLLLASLSPPSATEFSEVEVEVKELMAILDMKGKNYTYMKKITKELNNCSIEFIEHDGETLTQAPWMAYSKYKKGKMILKLNDAVKPFVLQLTGHFTKYKLVAILQLKSTYSLRIYEILMQYKKNIGERTVLLPSLRKMLGISEGKFSRWADFRRFVLDRAQKELKEKTDMEFDYFPIKKGKQVSSVKFVIFSNKKNLESKANKAGVNVKDIEKFHEKFKQPSDQLSDAYNDDEFTSLILKNMSSHGTDDLFLALQTEFGLSEKDVSRLMSEFSKEKLWEKFHYYHYCTAKQEIKNPTAWFISAVTKDYNVAEMKAEQKANEPDPLGDHLKELTAKQHELKIEINNSKQDISSEVAKYSESIRAGFEADLAKYQEELKTTTEEIQILKSAYATE